MTKPYTVRPEWADDECYAKHARHLAACALTFAISAWSEQRWFAGWLIGCESAAWAEAEVETLDGQMFRLLASRAGGWVEWGPVENGACLLYPTLKYSEGVTFVPWSVE